MLNSKRDIYRTVGIILFIGFSATMLAVASRAQTSSDEAPPVPFRYSLGMQKFQAACAECHGQWADGTDKGPTLVHRYYVPSHHSDDAFRRAILNGAPMHHWEFGDMPAVTGAAEQDAVRVTEFVRWLQQYRGLYK